MTSEGKWGQNRPNYRNSKSKRPNKLEIGEFILFLMLNSIVVSRFKKFENWAHCVTSQGMPGIKIGPTAVTLQYISQTK